MRSVAISLVWFAALVYAQGPLAIRSQSQRTSDEGPAPILRADAHWVRIPVSATNAAGAPETGLSVDDFVILEDGVPQEVRQLSLEDGPVSLGIVFDASSSMEKKLSDSRVALRQLFTTALPGDEYFFVEFSDVPRLLRDFTPHGADIEEAASRVRPLRFTALFDAVFYSLPKLRAAKNSRRALLILSDGADNYSRYSEDELRAYVREADVRIYSIALPSFDILNRNARTLRRLSDLSGGAAIALGNLSELPAAVLKMSRAIRQEYLLSYVSTNTDRDGLYRRVEVRPARGHVSPDVHLSWRRGYYAAQE
jgi:VWFA-related protein